MFQLVFQVLGNTARTPIKFAHIYGTGLCTTTVDMCKKQASGSYMLSIREAYAYSI